MREVFSNGYEFLRSIFANQKKLAGRVEREQELSTDRTLGLMALRDSIIKDPEDRSLFLQDLKFDMEKRGFEVADLGYTEEESKQIQNLLDSLEPDEGSEASQDQPDELE